MANHKSAIKRHTQSLKRQEQNRMIKSALATCIKKVKAAVAAKDTEAARTALSAAVPAIDKAAAKGVIHRNNAARKVARLTRSVAVIVPEPAGIAAKAPAKKAVKKAPAKTAAKAPARKTTAKSPAKAEDNA